MTTDANNNNNLLTGTRQRQMTERARIAAEEGVAGFRTNASSNSRTQVDDRDQPDPDVDSAPAGAIGQQEEREAVMANLREGVRNLPRTRKTQVGLCYRSLKAD